MSIYTKAAFWTITTQISVLTSMLLRNIIFARFLSPGDFAVTLTFGLVLSLFEYISNFGHENFMQRSNAGNTRLFQATMHSMMVARGLLISIIIIWVAPFIPILLSIEGIDFNYALLAIVPFINGFAHLDHHRLHRRQIYAVTAKIGLIADIASIFVALTCVLLWESYWAFYISFVFRHSASTTLSHIYAHRKYSLAFDHQYIKSLLIFGLPLLLVGLLKYIGIEFDKIIVTRIAGLEIFAVYVLTLMLLVNGTNIVTLALSKIFIRRISLAKSSISKTVDSNGLIHCFLVFPLLILLCGLGEDIILIIFGPQYLSIPFLIVAVGAVVGIRSINQWLNQAVIASSPTRLMLTADLIRVCIALCGVWIVYENNSAIQIAWVFWASEISYFFALSSLLHKRFPILKSSLRMISIYSACLMGIFILYNNTVEMSLLIKIIWSCIFCLFIASLFMLFSKVCRHQVVMTTISIKSKLTSS